MSNSKLIERIVGEIPGEELDVPAQFLATYVLPHLQGKLEWSNQSFSCHEPFDQGDGVALKEILEKSPPRIALGEILKGILGTDRLSDQLGAMVNPKLYLSHDKLDGSTAKLRGEYGGIWAYLVDDEVTGVGATAPYLLKNHPYSITHRDFLRGWSSPERLRNRLHEIGGHIWIYENDPKKKREKRIIGRVNLSKYDGQNFDVTESLRANAAGGHLNLVASKGDTMVGENVSTAKENEGTCELQFEGTGVIRGDLILVGHLNYWGF